MQTTYRAILRGDRLEWSEDAPDVVADQPVEVTVTVVDTKEDVAASTKKERIAEIFAQLAALDVRGAPSDAAAWGREIRQDRPLPGRNE